MNMAYQHLQVNGTIGGTGDRAAWQAASPVPVAGWLALLSLMVIGCGKKTEAPVVDERDVAVVMPDSPESDAVDAPLTPPRVDPSVAVSPAPVANTDQLAEPVLVPAEPAPLAGPAEGTALLAADTGAPDGRPVAGVSPQTSDVSDAATEQQADAQPTAALASDVTDDGAGAEGATGPEDWRSWPQPQVALVVSGNQHGYIEPCGCTGLENQKGGLARRMTFMQQLKDLGWELVPVDAGNQVRRFGRQAEIKFQVTATGLQEMGYRAVGFGPDDLRLGVGELIAVAAAEDDPQDGMFAAANVTLIDPSLTARYKLITAGERKIGVTAILDPQTLETPSGGEIEVGAVADAMTEALASMKQDAADFRVLLFYGEEDAAAKAVQQVAGFDLVVVAGGFGEPLYRPQAIEGSDTKLIVTGNKGMYAGIVALYPDADQPYRYARVPMTHEFADAPAMRQLMANYQDQLKALGLEGLGLRPVQHPSGDRFVGSKACGECHTTAYGIWENTPHAMATESIVHPGERGDVARHFDPECLSCHVTGWNPQNYYPYDSGYLSLSASTHLTGNGCENCHGPGAKHAAAEQAGADVTAEQRDALRMAMRLPLDKARDQCLQCHDIDNSPDFHKEGAFEDYWAEIEHYGLD